MASPSNRTSPATDRAGALYRLLRKTPRDRLVAPGGQPFAFKTHRGKVRKDNQDNALVLAGRHTASSSQFFAAILCDGMGGLEHGDDAADLAAANVGAELARDEEIVPVTRMAHAIRAANTAVFERFRGRAGTVLVAVLVENEQVVIGWVGDARIYGAVQGGKLELLTRDDTVAAEIARVEGAAPDAMDSLLRAIGQKHDVEPHVELLKPGFQRLLLASDGVHRITPTVLSWIHHHARRPTELVERLVAASSWEGGLDNATCVAVDLGTKPSLDEEGQILAAWAEAQPRIWQVVQAESPAEPRARVQAGPEPSAPRGSQGPAKATARARAAARPTDGNQTPRVRPQQPPLNIELDPTLKDES